MSCFVRRTDLGPMSVTIHQVQCFPGQRVAHYRLIVMRFWCRRRFGASVPRPEAVMVEELADSHAAALGRFDVLRLAVERAIEHEHECDSAWVGNTLGRLRRLGKLHV